MTNSKNSDSLENFFADEQVTDYLAHAESDPEAARNALLIAAQYIRQGKVLPGNLANHLAGAIEAAMAKPQRSWARELSVELHLTSLNRRPADDWATIGSEVAYLIEEGHSQEDAFGKVADNYKISFETVKKYWRIYKPAADSFYADMQSHTSKGEKPPTFPP